jgi:tripartite-type tricarboxylate transporter receptor subunit TctC
MMKRRDVLLLGMATVSTLPSLGAALAQAKYPDRPIRLMVPFPPGGVFDTIGRPWADKMKPLLGTVVVENQGGGGGAIGAAAVARAAPDGYTILMGGSMVHLTELILKSKPLYDPLKDLEPIFILGAACFAIVVHPSVPAKNLEEFVAYAKATPGKLSFGTAGTGSMNHLTGELLKSLAGIPDIRHVPYRGAGPAITDAISGHIPMIIAAVTGQVLELHRSGQLRVLAVTGPSRLVVAPDIPTAVEAGFPSLISQTVLGLFVPRGTSKAIKEQIAHATQAAMADPAYQQKFLDAGFEFGIDTTPENFQRFMEEEVARWSPIVKANDLKL